MKPEELARKNIDNLLVKAGWVLQNANEINLGASLGVAIREFPTQKGPADYMLFVNRVAVGVVEAKAEGITLSGVADQSEKYVTNPLSNLPNVNGVLPFAYESTGIETYFRNLKDPQPKSRLVFAFHTPETLQQWANEEKSLRRRLQEIPALDIEGLRDCQIEAVSNLENSFRRDNSRALLQMATGSGKTYTAVTSVYRLLKYADAKRVLFLVDRNNLGKQAKKEFQQYVAPKDGRKFTDLYNVQHLQSNTIDPVNKVCITTIQRLFSMLKGKEFDPAYEDESMFQVPPETAYSDDFGVEYNSDIPIDTFDFIITDECHRSIYNQWRQVLEYFDAYIIGLTATPSKQTFGFFNQNLVMEYPHERAVADGVNVNYEVFRIKTKISEEGSKVEAGYYVDKRNRQSRKVRWEALDDDLEYTSSELDREVVAKDQIRTILRAYRDNLATIFPDRTEVPKTLIFAKDDNHAEDIVHIAREEFGKGNDFCKKITYRTSEKSEDLIASFRNSYNPRIAVTVDMISTGTDIKPLECLIFMRDIKSRVYFEQMKGRGTRTISKDDLKAVTPDADQKTHFVIIDAVGVTENDKTDSHPLERKRGVTLKQLLTNVALGNTDEDTITSLVYRLSRFDKEIDEKDKEELKTINNGMPLKQVINNLLDAVDPDKKIQKTGKENPTQIEIKQAEKELLGLASQPFDNPKFRDAILEIKQRNEQVIDTISIDELTHFGASELNKVDAEKTISTFKEFLEKNKDEITALQILYSIPYKKRYVTYEQIQELTNALTKPPYNLNSDLVWRAYKLLDKSRVKGTPDKQLTNIISLVKYSLGKSETLEPFPQQVEERFNNWIAEKQFNDDQLKWLGMIKNHIANSANFEMKDFESSPFFDFGGAYKAYEVFGEQLQPVIEEVNLVLVGATQ